MKWKGIVGLVMVVTCCLSTVALADGQNCTREETILAESAAGEAKSWGQLYQLFERYAHCDDGAIAMQFNWSVSTLLANYWRDIHQLHAILGSDSSFHEFVIRHLNDITPKKYLERIIEHATTSCPQDLESLCREIELKASRVLPYSEE